MPFQRIIRMFLAAVFIGVLVVGPAVPARALTQEEERKMGREVFRAVQERMKLVDDPVVTAYIDQLGRKILQTAGPQPYEYRFFVVDRGVINAFAVPGGYVFINTETIAAMDNEGQLAAIVAHEIAHVTLRHIAHRIEQSRKITLAAVGGVLAGILIGGPVGPAAMMGSVAGGIQAMLAYSREDETGADRRGIEYLAGAGYAPHHMADAFQILLMNNPQAGDIPTYLSTHPGLDQRIDGVRDVVKAYPKLDRKEKPADDAMFQSVRLRVMVLYGDETRAEGVINRLRAKNPQDPEVFYGQALLYLRRQKTKDALAQLKKAVQLSPSHPGYLCDLGEQLFYVRDFEGALSALGRASVLRPNDPRPLFLLARVYEEEGQGKRAQDLYERVLKLDPNHTAALQQIGVVYGQNGDLTRAHLYTGLHYKRNGQYEKAWQQMKLAKSHAKNAPYDVQDRIEQELRQLQKDKFEEEKEKEGERTEERRRRGPVYKRIVP